jgi:hypothetical protein
MIDVRMLPKTLANIHTRGSPWKFTNRSPPRNPIDNHSQIFPLGGISEGENYKFISPRGLPVMFEDLRRLSPIWAEARNVYTH